MRRSRGPTKTVMSKQGLLKLAIDRRRQFDRERGEQDIRIEAAAAETLDAPEVRDDAERALYAAQNARRGQSRPKRPGSIVRSDCSTSMLARLAMC